MNNAFTEKDMETLSKLGYVATRIEKNGSLIGFNREDTFKIIIEKSDGGIKARVIKNPDSGEYGTPASITSEHENGFSPKYTFRSVKQAAEMALNNPLY